MTRTVAALLTVLLLLGPAGASAAPAPVVQGLDHMPLAVNDLDKSARDFERLGFVLKPGRAHDDGVRNLHVKFPNATEIELITAAAPTDQLASDYVQWLKGGDGPAYWALYAPNLEALQARLRGLGLQPKEDGVVTFAEAGLPHRLFFGDRLRSPTDTPAYFEHPNGAYRLDAVWLVGAAQEQALVLKLGAVKAAHTACAPFGRDIETLKLPEGDEVMFAPPIPGRPQARALLGATVRVKRLADTRRFFDAAHVAYRKVAGCGRDSLWVTPADAHGAWLEFRQ